MIKRIILIVIFIMSCFSGNSQIQEEQEIFIKKSAAKQKVYSNYAVEEKASFVGGDSKLFEFYKNNSKLKIKEFEIPNKSTYFNIYIDKDGNVYDCKIIKSSNNIHLKEIERLIGLMPKWSPAKHKNKTVNVMLLDYITFQ